MQKQYFDKLPKEEVKEKTTSHRKLLYITSLMTCVHYTIESIGVLQWDNKIRYTLFYMITIQHIYMLQHGALVCYLRECFSTLDEA